MICPQISRTLPMSLQLKYLLEAAVWAESPGLRELPRVALTLGHELSRRCHPQGFVVFWDYSCSITFGLVCFLATKCLTGRAWRVPRGKGSDGAADACPGIQTWLETGGKWRCYRADSVGFGKIKPVLQWSLSLWARTSKEVLESPLHDAFEGGRYRALPSVLQGRSCSAWGWV